MSNQDKYINGANGYLKTATGAFNKKVFGNQVVYNLLSMAIENYLTALCISTGEMPEHSGIVEILKQVDGEIEIPASFHTEAGFVNSFMNLCSLDVLEMKDPSDEDLKRMLNFSEELKCFCSKEMQEK